MKHEISDVLNLLQKVIAKKMENNVPKTTPLLNILKRNSGTEVMANNTFYVTEWVGNFSNVVQAQGGASLTGGTADNVQINVPAKRLFAHIQVDDFTIEAMRKVTKGALATWAAGYVTKMEGGIAREFNRTFNGAGDGKVARADGDGAATNQVTLQSLDADTSDILPTAYVEVGEWIKIGAGNAVQVTAINGNVATISDNRTWSDEDAIIKATADGGSTDEMEGLKSLITDTGTVQGVNIANYKNLQAYIDNTSRDISATGEEFMTLAYLKSVAYKASATLVGLTNLTVFNAWSQVLTALKKTANTGERIKGGLNLQGDHITMPYLDFMGGKVYMDIDTLTNHWFNLDPASMTIGDMGSGVKFATAPDGTQKWSRKTGVTPEYEGTMRFYGNLIMKNPKANAMLTNIHA